MSPLLPGPHAAEIEGFIIDLTSALHAAGTPAHRLERTIEDITDRLGLRAVVFSTPTMLMIGLGPATAQRTVLLRVHPVDVHLGRLDALDHIATWNAAVLVSDDLTESVAAAREKRAPVYRD